MEIDQVGVALMNLGVCKVERGERLMRRMFSLKELLHYNRYKMSHELKVNPYICFFGQIVHLNCRKSKTADPV